MTRTKAQLRKDALARRQTAFETGDPVPAVEHLTQVLATHRGKTLSGYIPMRSEIDPIPAMTTYQGTVCVPVVDAQNAPLKFCHWTPETPMQDGPFATRIPQSQKWMTPDVLIVPLVAFDTRGHRLGYGGGFYDRTLQALRANSECLAIGYAWATQMIDQMPYEDTDQPLDMIVTEAGVIIPN